MRYVDLYDLFLSFYLVGFGSVLLFCFQNRVTCLVPDSRQMTIRTIREQKVVFGRDRPTAIGLAQK
jgi:hypothetical protein